MALKHKEPPINSSPRLPRWVTLGVLITLTLAGSACSGADETEEGEATAETSTTEVSPSEAGGDGSDDQPQDTAGLSEGEQAGPGWFATASMGTEMTFNLDREWLVAVEDDAFTVLIDTTVGPDIDSGLVLLRPIAFPSANELVENEGGFSGPIDLAAWASSDDKIVASDPVNLSISGRSAYYVDVHVDPSNDTTIPGGCGPTEDDTCVSILEPGNPAQQPVIIVRTSEWYRIWSIDQGEEPPIIVFAFSSESDGKWFDETVSEVVASFMLGESAPHPVDPEDYVAGADPDSGATEVIGQFHVLEVGTIYTDSLGTRMTVEVEETLWVQPNFDGFFVLTDPSSKDPGDQDLVFLRPLTLADPSSAKSDPARAEKMDASSTEDWLTLLPDHVDVGEVTDTTVGGFDAKTFSLSVSESDLCDPERTCVYLTTNPLAVVGFRPGFFHRILFIDQGEENPIVVVLGWEEDDADWEARALAILETVTFGEVKPTPGTN